MWKIENVPKYIEVMEKKKYILGTKNGQDDRFYYATRRQIKSKMYLKFVSSASKTAMILGHATQWGINIFLLLGKVWKRRIGAGRLTEVRWRQF